MTMAQRASVAARPGEDRAAEPTVTLAGGARDESHLG